MYLSRERPTKVSNTTRHRLEARNYQRKVPVCSLECVPLVSGVIHRHIWSLNKGGCEFMDIIYKYVNIVNFSCSVFKNWYVYFIVNKKVWLSLNVNQVNSNTSKTTLSTTWYKRLHLAWHPQVSIVVRISCTLKSNFITSTI